MNDIQKTCLEKLKKALSKGQKVHLALCFVVLDIMMIESMLNVMKVAQEAGIASVIKMDEGRLN